MLQVVRKYSPLDQESRRRKANDIQIGLPTITDATDLVIRADSVLSLGAPKVGLLTALGRSSAYEKLKLFVADIGISNTIWRKFGTRRSRNGVNFGSEWVAALRYNGGVA